MDLDRASTAPLREVARAAMEPFLGDRYGNPSAAHALGRDAVRALDEARESIASNLGCSPAEVVVTSGGTESDVHAVTGGLPTRTGAVLCSAVEHPAVLRTVQTLGGRTVPVRPDGRIDLDALRAALDHVAGAEAGTPVELLSVMTANNELGTVNDIDAVAAVVAEQAPGVLLHTDAVQAAPWLDLRQRTAMASLVSVSAHKFGGPKGVGVLVARSGSGLRPLLAGGGQEWGLRSGTVDVAGVVGMAAALGEVCAGLDATATRVAALRDSLSERLCALGGVERTVAAETPTLPGTCHLLVDDVESEPLLYLLDAEGVRSSAASACASGAAAASHVLAAIGAATAGDPARRRGALRLSLGHDVTAAQLDRAVEVIGSAVRRLRSAGGARRNTSDRRS